MCSVHIRHRAGRLGLGVLPVKYYITAPPQCGGGNISRIEIRSRVHIGSSPQTIVIVVVVVVVVVNQSFVAS